MSCVSVFQKLPVDIINNILSVYDGRFKIRAGRPMTQIARDDTRYEILKTIPTREIKVHNNDFCNVNIWFSNKTSSIVKKCISINISATGVLYKSYVIMYNGKVEYIHAYVEYKDGIYTHINGEFKNFFPNRGGGAAATSAAN